jgi:hypothetical protein
MASAHHDPLRFRRGTPSHPAGSSHHRHDRRVDQGRRGDLAEVVPIRPETDTRYTGTAWTSRYSRTGGTGGVMRRITQAFAPLRVQLTTGVWPPRSPSSAPSSPRVFTLGAAPDDVA